MDREARIQQRAFEIWDAEGRIDGHDQDHWRRAEREVDEMDGIEGQPDGTITRPSGEAYPGALGQPDRETPSQQAGR